MSLVSFPSWGADFNKGVAAYKSGDFATALREFKPLAEQGNPKAQNTLGWMYRYGNGVPQDHKTAVKWYKLAADQGHADAQRNLGVMYEFGNGVPQDFKTAVKWYKLAADQGHADAQNTLGWMYKQGLGVPQDYKTAVKWYRLAADQGHAFAESKLAELDVLIDQEKDKEVIASKSDSSFANSSDYDRGVTAYNNQDYVTAFKELKPLAEKGHIKAKFVLGLLYRREGYTQPEQYREAFRWFKLAASWINPHCYLQPVL